MFRNMVTSLFKNERIKTTDTKAKEIRRWADHMITLAKRGDLHARRQALSIIREKKVVHKLFETANDRWGVRSGGYTRIVKLGRRLGDAAPMALVELVALEDMVPKKKIKKKATAPVTPVKPLDTKADTDDQAAAKDASTQESAVVDASDAADETLAEAAQEGDGDEGLLAEEKEAAAAQPTDEKASTEIKTEDAAGQTESEEDDKSKQ
jgi:large subunit ribosomal protein L17